jgi:hypothetical protein
MNTRVWTDTLLSHTEQQQQQLLEGDQQQATTAGSSSSSRLGSWDYSMPGRSLKARSRIKNTSRDKLKEHHQQRVRFNARHPFHRRQKGGGGALASTATVGGDSEELGWTLDQDGLTSAAAAGRLPPAVSGANSGSAASTSGAGRGGSDGHPLPSPASVGPFTPRPSGPDSVRNAAGDSAIAHPSPAPPLSNGPPTPFDALLMHPKTPGTPAGGGDGGPRSQAPSSVPPPSPYHHHHHRPGSRSGFSSSMTGPAGDVVKVEAGESSVNKTEEPPPPTAYEGPAAAVAVAGTNERLAAGKRPALPAKDYEEEEEEQGERRPQSVYDYTLLHAWLSHPVKKFKGELCSKVGTIMNEGTI